MPSREVQVHAAGEAVRFVLRRDGEVSETVLEKELLGVLYAADPPLESTSGRLIPGQRASAIQVSLFITDPDASGISHLGGILCNRSNAVLISRLLSERGYSVLGDV